jgi:hypothetical protein
VWTVGKQEAKLNSFGKIKFGSWDCIFAAVQLGMAGGNLPLEITAILAEIYGNK